MTMTPERLIELYEAVKNGEKRGHCMSRCNCVLCTLKYGELLDLLQPHARGIEAMIERDALCVARRALSDTAAAASAHDVEKVREGMERAEKIVQLIAQEYESNGAAVGAFDTPHEVAARKCFDAIRAAAREVKP